MEGEEPGGDEDSLPEEGEEEEEEEEEEEQVLAPCPLTEEVLKEGLSLLCKTGNGLAHAYVKLEAKYKGLTDISLLECFIHLRYVDLSENKLQDLSPLSGLTHLLWLKVDGNLLTSACMQELPYLQIISFAHNHIKDMEGITHPRLANLSLKGNKIQTALGLSHGQLFSLQILELRGNMLESTAGLNLPKLKNLYLVRDQPARGVGQSCCRACHPQSVGGREMLSPSKQHSFHASPFSTIVSGRERNRFQNAKETKSLLWGSSFYAVCPDSAK
uniref:Leucine-rich repeat-containing protein 23 n=1 Tax=Buteo japonicus TaxID=224669 RepID=A0A8C0BR23_9AVES